MNILSANDYDAHVHLFGIIDAETLWAMGKDRHKKFPERMQWFADEHFRLTQRPADPYVFWKSDSGFEALKSLYQITSPVSFSEFQASFNLLIAILGDRKDDRTVLAEAGRLLMKNQTGSADLRVSFPLIWDAKEISTYAHYLLESCHRLNRNWSNQLSLRLIFHISRRDEILKVQFQALKDLYASLDKTLRSLFIGFDFCEDEQNWPIEDKAWFFDWWQKESAWTANLDLCYHIGECFDRNGLETAWRWIDFALHSPIKRLGHCTALGYDIEELSNLNLRLPTALISENLSWLRSYLRTPSQHSLWNSKWQYVQSMTDRQTVQWTYDNEWVECLRSVQSDLLQKTKLAGKIIETCPTSNLRLGQIGSISKHPAKRFAQFDIPMMVGSDDPGLFGSYIRNEHKLLENV